VSFEDPNERPHPRRRGLKRREVAPVRVVAHGPDLTGEPLTAQR
jgi:hypothetical protein